jgi:hypothetical protein
MLQARRAPRVLCVQQAEIPEMTGSRARLRCSTPQRAVRIGDYRIRQNPIMKTIAMPCAARHVLPRHFARTFQFAKNAVHKCDRK